MSVAARAAWSACSGSTRTAYRPHSAARLRAHLRRNQLLHRHPDRAAPRARPGAAGAMGCTRADRLRGRPVDVLQAAARGPRALFGIDIHEMQPYRPLPEQIAEQIGRRAHADRRARLLVPARHRLPRATAREHVKSSVVVEAIDPRRRAAALLPRAAASTSSTGEDYRGVFRLGCASPRTCCRPTPSWCASTRARACGTRSCARGLAMLLRRHLARRPADNPFVALRRAARAGTAAAARGRLRRLPRLRLRDGADGRLGVRGRLPHTSSGCSASDGARARTRAAQASSRAARRSPSGSRAGGRSTPSRP